MWSCTKAATALCAHILASRGAARPQRTGRRRTGRSTARTARTRRSSGTCLSHQAGLPAVTTPAARRRLLRLGPDHLDARRAAAAVGTGYAARLPRPDVRLPRRRDRPPRHGPDARPVLREGGLRTARPRLLDGPARGPRTARRAHDPGRPDAAGHPAAVAVRHRDDAAGVGARPDAAQQRRLHGARRVRLTRRAHRRDGRDRRHLERAWPRGHVPAARARRRVQRRAAGRGVTDPADGERRRLRPGRRRHGAVAVRARVPEVHRQHAPARRTTPRAC